ncbi:MAG: hypothetical protein WDA03_02105 [Trueperaceae bacterium]|jgi:hypothetical protein
MDVKVVLTSEEIKRGLKHYRRIARQDLLRAEETDNPEAFKRHAEARRNVYAYLTEVAETKAPDEVALEALKAYEELPFVTGSEDESHTEIKGRENALENFFLMIGLEPKIRREVRSRRPSSGAELKDTTA